jgi:uncharacterized protein
MKDASNKGRNKTSRIGNGYTKLNKNDITEIVKLFSDGKNKSEISRIKNVTATRVRQILKGVKCL